VSDEVRQPPVHAQIRWLDSVKAGLTLVFVRDWHPVLRDPLDLVRLSFLVGAVVYATLGDWEAAVRLLAPGFFVFLVRAIDVWSTRLRSNPGAQPREVHASLG
jgi:hypothetical protein